MSFPPAVTEEQFEALDDDALRPGVEALCGHLGVSGDVERFADGSLPVYAVGDRHVLKLFPAVHLDEVATERDVPAAVQGRLPVPTPGLHAAGEFGGWGYVLMERLRGTSLKDAWPGLDAAARRDVSRQVGEALAALHALTPAPLEPSGWAEFVRTQRAGCVERQRARGLAPAWLEQVPAFLDSVDLGHRNWCWRTPR
ncbi:aminoglycoside 3'-phosphotransferase/choline kinase family protein [Actinosynnema sp. NPDC023794]